MSRFLGAVWDLFGARIQNLGTPVNPGDGVPKNFLAYDLPFVCNGQPNAGETFGPLLIIRPGTIPANFAGSGARVRTNPAAQQVLTFKRTPTGTSVASTIGTVTINTDGTFLFSTQGAITLALYDFIDLVMPATQDSAMADIGVTVLVNR